MRMRVAIATVAALGLAGCGGKTKDPAEPAAEGSCCCATGDGREVLGDAACAEAGGTCEPADTCETDGVGDGDGSDDQPPPDNDPTDY